MLARTEDGSQEYCGWIVTQKGICSFSISSFLDHSSSSLPDIRSLIVDAELKQLLQSVKPILRDVLQSARSVHEIGFILQKMVNLKLEPSFEQKSESSTLNILEQLGKIGWRKVKSINEDFTVITFEVHDSHQRCHCFCVSIPPDYPDGYPVVQVSLPVPYHPSSNRVDDLVSDIEARISAYSSYFEAIEDIDKNTWVLEPSQPTFAINSRRIAIERAVSIVVTINPARPLEVPLYDILTAPSDHRFDYQILGPSSRVGALSVAMTANSFRWDTTILPRMNLSNLLGLKLPSKLADDSVAALEEECAICYANQLKLVHSGDSACSLPDQLCANTRCNRVYHTECLLQWMQSLTSSRTSFGTVFGTCPYCTEPVAVKISS